MPEIYHFFQQLVNGLTIGSTYALIAIGYTMVYGIIGMINFAHGEVYMIGSYVAFIAIVGLSMMGLDALPILMMGAFVAAIIVTSAYGYSIERVAYRPLRGSNRLIPLISAIGMSIFLQNMVQVTQGARVKPIPPLLTGGIDLFTHDGVTVSFAYSQMLIIVVTLALMLGFTYLITRTSFGRQQRACEQDRTMTALLGINVDRTISLTFMIGAALAAVAGVLVTVYYGVVDFYIGFVAGIKAFTAAVLGGVGSLPGAMLGGLIIGLLEAFWAAYLSPEYKDVATFAILILVLMFRPSGLLGRPEVEKV